MLFSSSGNQVDQCFSILTSAFKTEIRTVEELFSKIRDSPISPKAEVEHLWFIWDWREFISKHFSDQMLQNHSHYHSFQLKREGEQIALRAKKYPQDRVWCPDPAIKLVKSNVLYDPVDVAPFRAEELNLEKVMSDLRSRYFPLFLDKERRQIESSWEKLSTKLMDLPKKVLPRMKLNDLVQQKKAGTEPVHPGYLLEHIDAAAAPPPELRGAFHPPTPADEMEFQEDARKGVDVVLWTHAKRSRPWVGRVHEILNDEEFIIHWYEKKAGNKYFASMQEDGSPYLSKQSMSSVMFWQMSINATEETFELAEYEMKRIMHEYHVHDGCYT
jgi:hypothetical protein